MKKLLLTSAALHNAAAIVKANLSGWYMLLALLFLSLFMSGCETTTEQEAFEERLPVFACTTEATAVGFTCALGAFNNNWLQLSDGTYLQPWVNATDRKELVHGQKYRLGFVEVVRDDRYDNIATCKAYVPQGKPVKVTCLEPLTDSGI